MENSSTITKLHAPLLGVKPVEVDQERHQNIITADIPVLVDDDVDEQEENNQKDASQCWYNFLLPLLLFVQFGVAFHVHDETVTSNLSWSIVNISILLFCLTVWLYRNTFIDTKMHKNWCIVLLLPEIVLNTVLVLVMLNKTTEAFYTLLLGMELLSTLAIVATVRHLYCSSHRQEKIENQQETLSKDDNIIMV
jgi:hypothetical protein